MVRVEIAEKCLLDFKEQFDIFLSDKFRFKLSANIKIVMIYHSDSSEIFDDGPKRLLEQCLS
jgi:hypothetical protein